MSCPHMCWVLQAKFSVMNAWPTRMLRWAHQCASIIQRCDSILCCAGWRRRYQSTTRTLRSWMLSSSYASTWVRYTLHAGHLPLCCHIVMLLHGLFALLILSPCGAAYHFYHIHPRIWSLHERQVSSCQQSTTSTQMSH